MLVDCATTAEDAEIILGAADSMGIDRNKITHILLTHAHGDHAGGLRHLLPKLPNATVCAGSRYAADRLGLERFLLLSVGQRVADGIDAVSLSGHSSDSVGYLDTESMTLITGDAVQLCGVGRYGCGLPTVCSPRRLSALSTPGPRPESSPHYILHVPQPCVLPHVPYSIPPNWRSRWP